jgi:uncharacterized coiled-coil DUF342 family protein
MATNNGGRVTIRDVYELVEGTRKELKTDICSVDERIDDLVEDRGDIKERVAKLEVKTDNLNRRVGAWDIGNTIGVFITGILAYFGIRN